MEIHAASRYETLDDLWAITCIFNPSGYRSKLKNYWCFAEQFHRSNLPLLTVECAFPGTSHEIPLSEQVVHVRSDSFLWQKERLLNIALEHLPPQAKKVVWVDADLLFSNPTWAVETSRLLDLVPFAQPFQHWCRLPENELIYRGEGTTGDSFAYRNQTDPHAIWEGRQGAPGFAFAARRDVLQTHGLYDAGIIGAGDNLIAHALNGTTDIANIRRVLGTLPPKPKSVAGKIKCAFVKPAPFGEKFAAHYERWAQAIYADARGGIGSVPGHLLHLWHGSMQNRGYDKRHEQMRQFDFDPDADLWKNADGTWEWSQTREDMRQWARDYFQERREDG